MEMLDDADDGKLLFTENSPYSFTEPSTCCQSACLIVLHALPNQIGSRMSVPTVRACFCSGILLLASRLPIVTKLSSCRQAAGLFDSSLKAAAYLSRL